MGLLEVARLPKGMMIMRQLFTPSAAALLTVALLVGRGAGTENHDNQPFPRRTPIVRAVEKTRNSIVTIKVPRPGTRDTVGTGVIVDESGYVVTNRHVVGSSATVNVVLPGGKTASADVIVAEPSLDLAILKLNAGSKFTAVSMATDTADLMVGETVIAIGHPFGYTNTVSTGIISALNREITMPTGDVLTGLIQTDASINPGNSGGPLLNINGQMIGINVALRDGAQGIAFAINAETVERVLSKHLSAGRRAGVSHGLKVKSRMLTEMGPQRVLVTAAAAQLKKGDEILAVGDRQVSNAFDIERALWNKRPGQTVTLKVIRNGAELTVQLTLHSEDGAGQATEARADNGTGKRSAPGGVPIGDR
jgi:serine protease Do